MLSHAWEARQDEAERQLLLQQAALHEQQELQHKQAAELLRLQQSHLKGEDANTTGHPGSVKPNTTTSPHAAGNATSARANANVQALPPSRPEQRPPAPHGSAVGKLQALGLALSATEASALLDLFFNHMTSPPGCAPSSSGPHTAAKCPAQGDWAQRRHLSPSVGAVHELKDEAARQLMGLMEGVWRALPPSRPQDPASEPEQVPGRSLCTSKDGRGMLAKAAEAAAQLHRTACSRALQQAGGAGQPSLPYVLLRRIMIALLVALHGQEGAHSADCRNMVSEVGDCCAG